MSKLSLHLIRVISGHKCREKSFCFSTKRLRFVACWFSFTLRWNDRVQIKLRSDAFLKFLFKIRLKRETNLMQACSANQHQVVTPSWLRKNALCLSQSAFSNFALHVITRKTMSYLECFRKTSISAVMETSVNDSSKRKGHVVAGGVVYL